MRSVRLRTKFLLSLLAISTMLTAGTLLIVSNVVQRRVKDNLSADLRNSLDTFHAFEKQRDETFSRSAQLLASLPTVKAMMTTGDAPTIQDASADVYRESGADMLVMADRTGKVEGLLTLDSGITPAIAQDSLHSSLERGEGKGWWNGGGHLYEIWIQKIYFGQESDNTVIGFLVLGDRIDYKAAEQFSTIGGSDVAFFDSRTVVASTLPGLDQAGESLRSDAALNEPAEIQIGSERYLADSVSLSDVPPVTLAVMKSFDKATAFLTELNRVLIGLGIFSILLGSVLVFLISHTFTRPLGNLVSGVRALEKGDFGYPLGTQKGDEVAEVTIAFDRMRSTLQKNQAEQKEMASRLRQAHKMEAVGRLAGGVAHDFNNLLTIIGGNSDILLDRAGTDDFQRRSAEQIQKAARRAVAMTRQLLAFSRMQVLQPQVLNLNTIVTDMGKILPRLIGEHIQYVSLPDPELATIKADPGQMEQVLMNLAVNARDAMPRGGTLTVKTENVFIDEAEAIRRPPMNPGNYIRLMVKDTGLGMDEKTKAHIFEPFFTTKEVGQGTGLGLATVYGVVKQSGGYIWVESAPGQGAMFEIYFPPASVLATQSESAAKPLPPAAGHETVLVVEDEPGVRELACRFLRVKGYSVLEAKDGADALSVAGGYKGAIHVVVTDMVMPGMGGADLIRNLKKVRPEVLVVFMTGYSEYLKGDLCEVFPQSFIIQKPFSPASLVGTVREALASRKEERVALNDGAPTA